MSANLCRRKRSFKPYQNEHNSVKDTRRLKAKNHVTFPRKFPRKSCSTTHLLFLSFNPKILKVFPKTFPTKMKPTKYPARREKMREEKRKNRGGEKAKSKSKVLVRYPSMTAQSLEISILRNFTLLIFSKICHQLKENLHLITFHYRTALEISIINIVNIMKYEEFVPSCFRLCHHDVIKL